MKILQVTPSFAPMIGGIEKVVEDLTKGLRENGFDTIVLTQSKGNKENYVKVFPQKNFVKLFFQIKSQNPDLIHVHGFRFFTPFVWMSAKLLRKPIIITPHYDYVIDSFKQKMNIWIHSKLGFSKIIALTQIEKNILLKHGFKNIEIIPNAVDLKEFYPIKNASNDFKKKFGIPEKNLIVLFVGRLASNKGIPVLIEAFSKINFKEKHLVIVGKEDARFEDTRYEFFKKLIKEKKLTQNATLTGELQKEWLLKAFNACEVFVLPSLSSEAFGLVLIQAMSCKKGVIASKIGGIPEVVDERKNGFLIEPNNVKELSLALQKLLENPALRKKFGENGRKKVKQKYALKKIIQSYLSLIKGIK